MSDTPICTVSHINHIALAVRDLDETASFYRATFGIGPAEVEDIADQGVRASLITVGGSQLELIQPTDPTGGVARFIERRGEGLHHICFEVGDLERTLESLAEGGVELVDHAPRKGLSGMIAFIHPRSTGGVLVELVDRASAAR